MAETAIGGCVRLAASARARVRPAARSNTMSSLGRSVETLASIRVRASATESISLLFIARSLYPSDGIVLAHSNKLVSTMCCKQFSQTLGLILALLLASPTEIIAQNNFTPDTQKKPRHPRNQKCRLRMAVILCPLFRCLARNSSELAPSQQAMRRNLRHNRLALNFTRRHLS